MCQHSQWQLQCSWRSLNVFEHLAQRWGWPSTKTGSTSSRLPPVPQMSTRTSAISNLANEESARIEKRTSTEIGASSTCNVAFVHKPAAMKASNAAWRVIETLKPVTAVLMHALPNSAVWKWREAKGERASCPLTKTDVWGCEFPRIYPPGFGTSVVKSRHLLPFCSCLHFVSGHLWSVFMLLPGLQLTDDERSLTQSLLVVQLVWADTFPLAAECCGVKRLQGFPVNFPSKVSK